MPTDPTPKPPEDMRALVERLRASQPLPVCPYDRRSPDYWTTSDNDPCKFCGSINEVGAPDLCRGADTRVMGEAAEALIYLQAERDRLQAENEALWEAATSLLAQKVDYYTSRNGRRVGIEGDDGEKCWIIPSDAITELERAVQFQEGDHEQG